MKTNTKGTQCSPMPCELNGMRLGLASCKRMVSALGHLSLVVTLLSRAFPAALGTACGIFMACDFTPKLPVQVQGSDHVMWGSVSTEARCQRPWLLHFGTRDKYPRGHIGAGAQLIWLGDWQRES